jgi:hypothetical protein
VLAWDFKATNSSLGFMSASLAGLTAAMVSMWGQYRATQQHLRTNIRLVLVLSFLCTCPGQLMKTRHQIRHSTVGF